MNLCRISKSLSYFYNIYRKYKTVIEVDEILLVLKQIFYMQNIKLTTITYGSYFQVKAEYFQELSIIDCIDRLFLILIIKVNN